MTKYNWWFFILLGILWGGLSGIAHYYLLSWINRSFHVAPDKQKLIKRIAVWAFIFSLLPMALSQSPFIRQARPLWLLSFGWIGTLVCLFIAVVASDIIRLAARAVAKRLPAAPLNERRRAFFGRLLASSSLGGGTLLTGGAIWQNQRPVETKRTKIAIPRLPKEFDGFRIAQITDTHFGPMLDSDWLEGIVAQTNALGADMIAITGDIFDGPTTQLAAHVQCLTKLRAPNGVFFVLGNHDYYWDYENWIVEVRKMGITVLLNERVTLKRGTASLDVVGIDDHTSSIYPGHGADLGKALGGRDPRQVAVLLAHQPKAIKEASEMGVDLQLSGHTHGGQLWPWKYFVLLQQPFVNGLHKVKNTWLYVSEATGFWGPPMRLGTKSEIAEITLVSGGE